MQLLLVDDDLDDQEIFLLTLEQINKDIQCSTANNGVEALKLLKESAEFIPNYIFLDVNMPKMNGIDCLKGIRDFQHLKDSRVFMYSTSSEVTIVERAKELGAEDLIVKPTSPAVLKEILSNIIKADK